MVVLEEYVSVTHEIISMTTEPTNIALSNSPAVKYFPWPLSHALLSASNHPIILSIYPGIMMAVLEECVSVTHEIISMTTEPTNVGNVRRYNPILIHVI